jgi:hypothetical protein
MVLSLLLPSAVSVARPDEKRMSLPTVTRSPNSPISQPSILDGGVPLLDGALGAVELGQQVRLVGAALVELALQRLIAGL